MAMVPRTAAEAGLRHRRVHQPEAGLLLLPAPLPAAAIALPQERLPGPQPVLPTGLQREHPRDHQHQIIPAQAEQGVAAALAAAAAA